MDFNNIKNNAKKSFRARIDAKGVTIKNVANNGLLKGEIAIKKGWLLVTKNLIFLYKLQISYIFIT